MAPLPGPKREKTFWQYEVIPTYLLRETGNKQRGSGIEHGTVLSSATKII
jgi:hypothetical protein